MSHTTCSAASHALGLGQFDRAEGLYRSVPAGAAEYAEAVSGLGVIAYQRGRTHEAVLHFSRLVALRPRNATDHSNLGECLRECGRFDEALTQLQIGLALDPDQPDAYNSVGLIHQARRRLAESEAAFRNAIRRRPEFPTALVNLGTVLQELRRPAEALDCFRRALALDPSNPMALSNLGQILVEMGRIDDLDEAERCCLEAVRLTPDRPHPINNLGNVYRAMGRVEEAVQCYEKAMAIAPQLAMPLNNMGQVMQGRGLHAEAAKFYLDALVLEPNSARFHANYAALLLDQDLDEDALARYRHALEIEPDHPESYHGMGQVYMKRQETERAESCFRKALEIDPALTAPRLGLSNLYSELGDFARADVEAAIALKAHPKLADVYHQRATHRHREVSDDDVRTMTALLDARYLGERPRAVLNFALGEVHDRQKDYRSAGAFFRKANAWQAAARLKRNEAYEPETHTQWVDRLIEAFSTDLMSRLEGSGHGSSRPVFVVGMPRSGTTLTEQILASHPAIHGGGELVFLNQTLTKLPNLLGLAGTDVFSALKSVTPDGLKANAGAYLKEIGARNADAGHFVDKMPDNINLLGWIHLIFPNARVIHCRRDLRDVALSCWQTCFGSIRWANDWGHIARRVVDYLRLVEHWKTLGNIEWLDFHYEAVIEDPEGSTRDLIAYLDLDWEPSCLRFHETRRPVRTASLSQVREPIYRTSVAKWRHYERDMASFLDETSRLGWSIPD